jgi:hypothetical protein
MRHKKPKLIIAKFLILVPATSLLIWVLVQTGIISSTTKDIVDVKYQDQMVRDAMHLQSVWLKGDLELISKVSKAECVDLIKLQDRVTEEFFHCNSLFLECYLLSAHGQKLTFKSSKVNPLTWSKTGDPQVKIRLGHSYFQLALFNTCHNSILPEGFYSAGPKNEKRFLWDNFNREVFIDKYYVSNLDVWHWLYRHGRLTSESDLSLRSTWGMPNTSLKQNEREEYCQSLGKKVLRSHYFDAATGFVSSKKVSELVDKFPYPWTKHRKTFLNLPDQKLTSADCFNAFVKGCEKYRLIKDNEALSTTWIGIHFALGRMMEYLPNPFLPHANLKVSSQYLEKESFWHELGLRAKWHHDQEQTQIDWVEQYTLREDQVIDKLPSDEYQVGFRCVLD